MNLLKIGNELSYGGFLLTNGQECWVVPLPEEYETIKHNLWESITDGDVGIIVLDTRNGEFEKIIRQTDIVETEIFDQNANAKVIVRKSQRQLDQLVIWKVYRRDDFQCRYCGRNDVPLTYDHVMLWEDGGPCTEENGISACRKCNKTRGNMKYEDWLKSDYYLKNNKIPSERHSLNLIPLMSLMANKIQPVVHKRGR